MVPEVEYLADKGYFSRAETRSIVQSRLVFEHKLKAKVPEKESYWRCQMQTSEGTCRLPLMRLLITVPCRYIAYEKGLAELHALRKAAAASQQTDTSLEAAIPRRIHWLYEQATRRFKGELRFWHAWLDWCEATEGGKRFFTVCTTVPVEDGSSETSHNGAGLHRRLQERVALCQNVFPASSSNLPAFYWPGQGHSGCVRTILLQALTEARRCELLQVLAGALGLHPKEPDLWTRAAARNFDPCAKAAAAR